MASCDGQAHGTATTRQPDADAAGATLAAVASTVQGVLGFAPPAEQPLMEAGLDSLGAVELRNSLASCFGIPDLPATLTFDHPSITALAQFFAGENSVCRR